MNTRRNPERNTELLEEEARLKRLGFEIPETARFRERSTVERANSRIKDDFGGRSVRVRGHAKVFCHLMFGVLTLAADQLAGWRSQRNKPLQGARLAHPLAGAAEGYPENGNSKALASARRDHTGKAIFGKQNVDRAPTARSFARASICVYLYVCVMNLSEGHRFLLILLGKARAPSTVLFGAKGKKPQPHARMTVSRRLTPW